MNDPINLKSGATLVVTIAPFDEGNKLLQAVARELARVDFDLDFNAINFEDISAKDVNLLKNAVFQLVQSESVEMRLHQCMKRCLYNGERIDLGRTFNSENARQDYLPIVWEVMKANLRPFFSGIDLSSLTSGPPQSSGQKS